MTFIQLKKEVIEIKVGFLLLFLNNFNLGCLSDQG